MANIFENTVVYYEKSELVEERNFNETELGSLSTENLPEVIISPYGNTQVKCTLKTGGICFFLLDPESTVTLGDKLDLKNAKLRTWKRPSETKLYDKILAYK